MYPLLASLVVPGFPMTSLSSVTPLAEISKMEDLGQSLVDCVRTVVQVV